jgi:DNA-binding transcriptional regulator PaaX
MRKGEVEKIILGTVALAGIISIAVLAPNALQMLKLFQPKKANTYRQGNYLKSAIARLHDRGLIRFEKRGEYNFVRLTAKGRQALKKYQLGEEAISKPKKWDGKWRVLIFDIKEQSRQARDKLRRELARLGFVRLQNSVWVHPYECEDIVILLKAHFRLGRSVLYLTVEKIENDAWLRKNFYVH